MVIIIIIIYNEGPLSTLSQNRHSDVIKFHNLIKSKFLKLIIHFINFIFIF